MWRALETADPVKRMGAAMLLLERMTPGNAREIFEAFKGITTKTGRTHPGEWALMLNRLGEVLGPEALDLVKGDPFNLAQVAEGMAAGDYEKAVEAVQALGKKDKSLVTALLAGLCRKDTRAAFSAALDPANAGVDAGLLFDRAVHKEGLDAAVASLQAALDESRAESADSPAFHSLFRSLASAVIHKSVTNGTVSEAYNWFEKQKGEPYITPALMEEATRKFVATGDFKGALQWTALMNSGPNPSRGGGQALYDFVSSGESHLKNMDVESFRLLVPLIPPDPENFEFLALLATPVNPEFARILRDAMPAPEQPESAPQPSQPPQPD
jgi:hypothetical protein